MSVNSDWIRRVRRRQAARGVRVYGEPARIDDVVAWALFVAGCLLFGVLVARLAF
jgi:hypothetical protein